MSYYMAAEGLSPVGDRSSGSGAAFDCFLRGRACGIAEARARILGLWDGRGTILGPERGCYYYFHLGRERLLSLNAFVVGFSVRGCCDSPSGGAVSRTRLHSGE